MEQNTVSTAIAQRILIEQLPDEEFDVLNAIAEGTRPDPTKSIVIVGRDGAKIVSRMMLLSLAHIEGTWIDPEYRSGTIFWRMIQMLEKVAHRIGITKLFAYTDTEDNGGYMKRLGYHKTNFVVWVKELKCQ